jgi:hypothetical protein
MKSQAGLAEDSALSACPLGISFEPLGSANRRRRPRRLRRQRDLCGGCFFVVFMLGCLGLSGLVAWWCVCPIRRDWRSDDFELVNLEGRDGDDAGQR